MTPQKLIEPARHAGTTLLRTQSDERLVDLTRNGNDRAFEAVVERYRKPLLRYCSRLLPASRAEDAVQQTFLSAYGSIRSGQADLRLRPWLYRIAHNASLNLLRQNGWNHDQVSEEIDGVPTPPQIFERNERLRSVIAAVADLPERQRDAIVLQAVEGRSYEEIAAELGVSGGAVRQLLNRARNTLRSGVGALVPSPLVVRLAADADGGIAERVAQATAGAGGVAGLAKLGTALLVTGAVVGGATQTAITGGGSHRHSSNPGTAAGGHAAKAKPLALDAVADKPSRHGREPANDSPGGRRDGGRRTEGSHRHASGRHGGRNVVTEHHDGGSSGGGVENHSGSGSSGSGDGSRSGSGGGTTLTSNSGGGSSGSGTSGSGDSRTTNSGDGSSGSGSSGDGGGMTTTTTTTSDGHDGGGGTSGKDGGGSSGRDGGGTTTTDGH